MLNKVLENQAEQIAVTPDQAAFVLQNKKDFKNKLDVDVSMYNTNIANSFINNKLENNPDWNKYLQDPFRRNNPDYKRWKSVEDLMTDSQYTSIAIKYGEDLAKQSDIVLDYVKPKSMWDRLAMGYNAARYGLRYADARKKLSDALEDGDENKIAEAREELQKELFNLQFNSNQFESGTSQAAASIGASIARNLPEMIISDTATSIGVGLAAGPVAGGASLLAKWGLRAARLGRATKTTAEGIKAARSAIRAAEAIKGAKAVKKATDFVKGASKAGIVFGDTYNIESGSIMLELDKSHPELTEDQKRDLAEAGGLINATIETIPMLAGVGFQAGMSKVLGKATTNAMLKTGVTGKMVKDPVFLKEFAKQIEKNSAKFKIKNVVGDVAADMFTNTIQEVLQDSISKAVEYVASNPDVSILERGWDMFVDFLENPTAERNAEMLDTALSVMAASPFFSGGIGMANIAVDSIGSGPMWKKASGAKNNATVADKLNKWAKESEASQVAPDIVNQNLANMVKNGDAPATVYFDTVSIKEALESTDKEVQEAMQKLDMARRYEESKSNGGTIEMSLPEYNELVNQEKTGTLFQVVRSMVSFDPNSLSSAEFLRYMTSDGEALSVLEGAMEDKDSAYNKAYNKFIEAGWDEKQARFDATMAQLVSNRLASVTGGGMTGSEYFAKNIDVRTGVEQPVGTTGTTGALQQAMKAASDLAAENEILDAQNEPYEGDTIVVNGVERPTKNSDGNPIAKSQAALENFWNWFGDSKVVDEDGRPLVVYHGTNEEFEAFDLSKGGAVGFFFTGKKEYAEEHAEANAKTLGGQPRTISAYLKIDNLPPREVVKNAFDKSNGGNPRKQVREILSKQGYDGYTTGGVGGTEYIVFEPNQIKSTENIGTFDPANPDIRYQFVGSIKEDTVNQIADTLGKRTELDEARAMEQDALSKGETPDYEAIWQKTGWYKEPDTSWSYEIADNEASLVDSVIFSKNGAVYTGAHTTLGKALKHDKLFDLFPELKDIPFHIGKSSTTGNRNSGRSAAVYYSNPPEIIINASNVSRKISALGLEKAKQDLLSTVLHELQHAIGDKMEMMFYTKYRRDKVISHGKLTAEQQEKLKELRTLDYAVREIAEKNGITLGYGHRQTFAKRNELLTAAKTEEEKQSVKDFVDKYIETEDYNISSDEGYYRESAEVQARNTQTRLNLTEEQRRQVSPSATVDISGTVQVARSVTRADLQLNTRKLRVIKFAGVPVEATTETQTAPDAGTGQEGAAPATPQSRVVAGWFQREGEKLVVNLTKAANATTFSHEMFHAFSNVLMEQYNNGQLSKYWKRQAENLFESVGAKANADGKVVLTNTQEEHLADQFTTYILEGKVPSSEVSSIFALVKDWFKKAYLDFGIRHLGLNKKVTEVFDSIFLAQEEVEQRQRALGLVEFPMPEGADQGLYDKYVSHLLNSRAKASAKLVRAWHALQKRKTSKEYTKRRGDVYNAVRSELEQSTAYQYQALLNKNNGDHVAAYNEYLAKHPEVLESETPITPDVLREMVEDLPPIDQEANRLTEQQMDEEMAAEFKIDKEPAASKTLRNTEKVKALLAEALLHEGKKLSDFESEYSAFLDNAERIISKLSISSKKNTKGIRNFTYWTNQEGMAVERYTYAYAQQDKAEMAQQRRNQALFTMIRIRGEEIDNRAMRFKTQFEEKLRNNQKPDIINKETGERADLYTAEAWDLMQSIIEKFGFKIVSKARVNKSVAEKMEDWIKDQENKSMTTIGFLRNFIPFVGKGYDGQFSQMSVNMFEQLENIMTAVNSVARTEKFVMFEGEKHHLNEIKRDIAETLAQKGIKPTTKAQGWLGKTFGGLGKWTNPEPVLQAFFSDKVLNTVFRPFFSAAATADSKGNAWIARYRVARDKLKLTGKYKTFSNGVKLTDAQVVDLFLSMGTQHAYENFMKALKVSEEQAEQVVSEALAENPELGNFVTEYWNLMSETADAMNESHKKRTNRVLVKKEPRAFTINGIQFTGGYVPENKGLLREITEGDYNSLQMGLLANEKEITKEADGTVKSIIDNTESRLGLFAKWAYAAPEYNNICKLMSEPDVKEMLGEGLTEFIFNWLWSFQTPTIDTSGVVRPLSGMVSVAALGFRAMQGIIQLSGLVPAVATIGAKNVLFGMRKTMLTSDIFQPIKNARSKSAYMANRYDNPMDSILGFDKKDIKRTKIGNVYQSVGMSIIVYFDAIVASAVWEGAYADAISKGLSEQDAVLQADAAVRVSQTDSMSASRSQALQSPWARAITSFSTYIMGMQSVVRANLAAGERFKAALFAVNYMVFATFFESMYREAVNVDDEDDDKKYIERVSTRWYNDMVKTLGSSAIPVFGLGGSVTAAFASGVEKAFDVDEEIFESYAPSSALHTYLSQIYYLAQNTPAAIAGDEKAQEKAILNSVGLVSTGAKKIVKEWLNQ